jgi:2-polyprenyl-3-methyl-5-hydroxy-6-metoxy-1,4-benzoquinol methylase
MTLPTAGSALQTLIGDILSHWPEHKSYLDKSFASRAPDVLRVSETLAGIVQKLATTIPGGIDTLCADYRFLCDEIVLPEELFFRRNGRYRLSSFEDANRECYANAAFMNRYMNGLLISDIVWDHHAHAIGDFVNSYLPKLKTGADLLEIGPGHGIFLYFAAMSERTGSLAGWDVSPTSIKNTRHALETLGVERPVDLTLQNLFDAGDADAGGRFDSIVMSEILEHLEDPVAALRAASAWLRPGGSLWINVPANSPMPDHIFLFEGIEHACDIARESGLEVEDSAAFPMSGVTLEKAVKRKQAVSCVVSARKPA